MEFIGSMTTSEELSGKAERRESLEELTDIVAAQLLKTIKNPEELLAKIDAAVLTIADANPVEELVELARFLCLSFYRFLHKMDTAPPAEYNKYVRRLKTIERVVKRYYASVLGVPTDFTISTDVVKSVDVKSLCEKPGNVLKKVAAIGIKIGYGSGRGRPRAAMAVDVEKLRKILRERIADEKVVVKTKATNASDVIYIAGHDTSYWPIELGETVLSQLAKVPLCSRLYVLAGIKYLTWREARGITVRAEHDIVPQPEKLAELKSEEAICKGYIITPEMIEQTEKRAERMVEAGTNIIEYSLIEDAILNPTRRLENGPPPTPPKPILHDGRLYPYEHKLADYAGGYGDWHSKLVRISIYRFSNIVRAVIGDPRLRIVGVVKRARAPYIHPLIVWLLFKNKMISEEKFWEYIGKDIYERWEVTRLLSKLFEVRPLPKGYTYRTFGVIRRYWVMDEEVMRAFVRSADSLEKEYDQHFWLHEVVFSIKQEYGTGLKGYLDAKGIEAGSDETLAYVYANASVALTYIVPPDIALTEHVLLPRFEVLVPPLKDRKSINTVREALNSLAIPIVKLNNRVLYGYEIANISEDMADRKVINFLVIPYHIYQADQYARVYDNELRERYVSELISAVVKIIKEEQTAI